MKLETGREPTSEILGASAQAGHKAPSADLFSTTQTTPARVHQTFRSSPGAGKLPLAVIPADFDLDEFFATIATYYPSQSPLTAYVHVLGKDLVSCLDPAQPEISPESHGSMSRNQVARLGACLGETALAAFNSAEGAPAPSYSACRRSLGYVLARAVALYPSLDADIAVERWSRLRRLTGLAVSQVALRTVRTIHFATVNGPARSDNGALAEPLRSALVNHLVESNTRDALQPVILELYPELSDVAIDIDGPFDGRMSAFLKLVEKIQRATRGAEADSLAVGYYCNRILPGSFAHGKVLARLVEFFPSALIWYGTFCSTSPGFDVRQFGNGLLAKLARDVSLPFSFAHRPQCDLSLDELDVLMRGSVRAEAIKPIQQKIATVALLPGLDVYSRFAPEEDTHIGRESQSISTGIVDERLARATQLLDEAVALLHELGVTHERRSHPASNSKRQRKR